MQKLLFTWNFIIVQIPLKSSRLLPDISLLTTDLLNRPYITVCMLLSAIKSKWNPRSRDQILFSVVSPRPSTVPGTQHIFTTGLVGCIGVEGETQGISENRQGGENLPAMLLFPSIKHFFTERVSPKLCIELMNSFWMTPPRCICISKNNELKGIFS